MSSRENERRSGRARLFWFLAAVTAVVSWGGLTSEAVVAWQFATLAGRPPLLAVVIFWRFFTNLTVLIVAVLMTVSAWQAGHRRPPPPATFHAAALVYILVVSITYELLLRRSWSPHGIWFVRDAVMHDLVPLLMLVFWLFCAPKRPLSWIDPIKWLVYPATYISVVLVSGAAGLGYPYPFIDPGQLGTAGLVRTISAFAAAFLCLGLIAVGIGKTLAARAE